MLPAYKTVRYEENAESFYKNRVKMATMPGHTACFLNPI